MCDHETFQAQVDVNRLEDTKDGDSLRCAIDLHIWCEACKAPLLFALPFGLNLTHGATMSIDGTEARFAGRIGIPKDTRIAGFSVIPPGDDA